LAKFARARKDRPIVAPHLDRWFQAAKFPNEIPFNVRMNKPKDTAFHPSSSSDTLACPRTMYYQRSQMDPKGFWIGQPGEGGKINEATSQKNFAFGHMVHELLQFAVVDGLGFSTWDDIEKEHRVRSDGLPYDAVRPDIKELVGDGVWAGGWWGKGSLDVAHCVVPVKGDYVVDFKTCDPDRFKFLKEAPDYYVAQMKLYLDWEQQERGIILFVSKGSGHDFKEFVVEADPQFCEDVYSKWDAVSHGLVANEAPECECEVPHTCPSREYE
jgi:hypothetical protein